MARKFYNPRTYPIHVADGTPVASGDTFSADPDADWLQPLLATGDAVPIDASRADEDQASADAAVAAAAEPIAKAQARASTGDNEGVKAAVSPKEKS